MSFNIGDRRTISDRTWQELNSKRRPLKAAVVYRTLLILIALGAVVALVVSQYVKHVYTDYEVISSVSYSKASGATDVRLGNSIMTFSTDGAHCTAADGSQTWNQTYEISNILLSVNGTVAAIGSYNGREIYVVSENEILGSINTNMPIRNIAVAENGNVSAVLSDSDTSWLNTYDPSGKQLFTGATHMANSGYPGAMALSPGGELLGVVYTFVDSGELKTTVAFYNLGEVGDNYNDYLVSAYTYTNLLVPEIGFLSDEVAYAVGDGRLMVYTGAHKPTLEAEYLFDDELRSVYHSDRFIGLVYYNEDPECKYKLALYKGGTSLGTIPFDIEYTDIIFGNDNIVIYNESECHIVRDDGMVKYDSTFNDSVSMVIPKGNTYKYLLVTDKDIQQIQLK